MTPSTQVAQGLAEQHGFAYVDLYALSQKAPDGLFGDAVHLSGKGDLFYRWVWMEVWNNSNLNSSIMCSVALVAIRKGDG